MDYEILPVTSNQTVPNQVDLKQNQVMGKDDFLRLLVTQLNHQDPLNPMDGQEFAAQLAQFSSLEQLSQINSNLDLSLQSDLMLSQSIANNLAVGLIGREVLALDNRLTGEESQVYLQLGQAAAGVTIEIRNAAGNLVRTLTGGELEAGIRSLSWDGRDEQGNSLPAGDYTFSVAAVDGDGISIATDPVRCFHAAGVVYENGIPWLLAGDHRIAFADVLQVMEATPPDQDNSPPLQQAPWADDFLE